MSGTFHVVGAGLAGLSAAVSLVEAGKEVVVHEAAAFAGGRCRSYHDAATGLSIDNGNHLLLSGNHAVLDYLRAIGAEDRMSGPSRCRFAFVDLSNNERWTLAINDGRFPLWIFNAHQRVPGTRLMDYASVVRLSGAVNGATVGEVIACTGPLYERLLNPLLRAALNIEPARGSARLARAIARETLASGGRACRPLIARDGLTHALIDPAIDFLRKKGARIQFGQRLSALQWNGSRVGALDLAQGGGIEIDPGDQVILAVPPVAAAALVPGLRTPTEFCAIVNAHFRLSPPPHLAPITGIVNGTAEWLFAFPGRLSVTISAADRLLDRPREELAKTIWRDVARVAGLADDDLPPWQIVRERRATFAATPQQEAQRPGTATAWDNLFLAGDWTDTGLPATMEGAVRSGVRAARFAAAGRA